MRPSITLQILLQLVLLLGYEANSYAVTLYKQIDAQGRVTYTDQKPSTGQVQEIQIEPRVDPASPSQTATPQLPPLPKPKSPSLQQLEQQSPRQPYQHFVISSPQPEAVMQNTHQVSIRLRINPALQAQDKIQIVLNGVPQGKPEAKTSFQLTIQDRGEQKLQARLIDSQGVVLKTTPTITIFMHQARIKTPANSRLLAPKSPVY